MLTATMLKAALQYSPETGLFRWRIKPNRRIRIGQIAGTITRVGGPIQIKVFGELHRAHRLAWLYVHEKWPTGIIDHKNGNPTDNRIANLRDTTWRINNQNKRKAKSNSRTGILGVSPNPNGNRFRARIDAIHLGTFASKKEAQQVYLKAKRELHEGYVECE
jgi:hypothetical protein